MALLKSLVYSDDHEPMEAQFAARAAIESRAASSSRLFGIDTKLLQNFTMPAAGADATAEVGNSSIFTTGQIVFLADIGYLRIMGGSPSPKSGVGSGGGGGGSAGGGAPSGAIDYSNGANWLRRGGPLHHNRDAFAAYPNTSNPEAWISEYLLGFINVFAPIYNDIDDMYDAFRYYMENLNNGRPFVLFGEGHGGEMVKEVATTWLGSHLPYNAQHIATYTLGLPVTSAELSRNPGVSLSTSQTDAHVIVTDAMTPSVLIDNIEHRVAAFV